MSNKIKEILAGIVLLFFCALLLTTPIGILLILVGAGWITWKLHEYLEAKGHETIATIFILFFAVPTILVIGGGASWFVGCIFGLNGCRSPF